ncbi:MAG: hypothetical protein AUI50_03570 [Crenarchaeota archaeon 13_1_40CM_2_52_14]|nr:MAG: hypothetical protein AUI97_06760 [Crenarchaeota archaeon 13_1_40CM_3_52_17]OLD35105.1 MAG: hypothetical protein AUI50_03570 [Crenarchaeota archaeon 13_1_40CM_2_52_14]OLE68092.1 MAG: hypothetical protein AUF78_17770 [archaeon 13_1_20CM_2_51_12]
MKINEPCDLLLARRKSRKVAPRMRNRSSNNSQGNREISPSKESIKAAEELALAAFASGLKLAAAFGTVAAKTTSLALASIATGADKFSELVKQEAIKSQKAIDHKTSLVTFARGRKRAKRQPKLKS